MCHSNVLQVFQTFDISLHNLAACTRTGTGDGVAGLNDRSDQCIHLHLIVVRTDGVAYLGFLAVLLAELHADLCVRQLVIFVSYLAYIVQQTGTTCRLRVQTKLRGHRGTEVGCLARVLQQVLAVRRTVLHLSYQTNKLRMQTVYTQVDGCAFAYLYDLFFDLLGYFRYHLLDTCRVDSSVLNELMQTQSGYLAADGIECAQGDALRRIIYYDLHTCGSFEGADVSSFATDDAAFHLVVVNVEDAHCVLHCCFAGYTLDGLDDHLLCFHAGVQACFVHRLVDERHSLGACFGFQTLNELLLCLLGRHAGEFFELLLCLLVKLFGFGGLIFDYLLLFLNLLRTVTQFVLLTLQFALALVELLLTLLQTLVGLLAFLLLLMNHVLMFGFQSNELLFGLDDLVLLDDLGFGEGFLEQSVTCKTAYKEADGHSHKECCHCYEYYHCIGHSCSCVFDASLASASRIVLLMVLIRCITGSISYRAFSRCRFTAASSATYTHICSADLVFMPEL